ncbi:MAG: ribonuclease HI family protein [Candidatus Methanomethylophilaceae archaeon]|jgi:ribonuclease HI|nr:phosphoglycerate mutase [Methanomassiliicoccales archaeon RumEn M2]MDD2532863.1 ribonuclease HI family protein [Candidatus Methanomethylophilaceae archaeon]MDD2779021.1 ribonuclease HI family protein [Candidatus Methanomethylophilaceae archaeon]MDD3128723.1 ribonuclease HI family protein [Candidatus Methanomethylophilaceae archaeon]
MLRIYSDGGARGNPGPSACAVIVTRDGSIIREITEFLGESTNNYAEYRGLIAAIREAIRIGDDHVEFVMDSELVVKQMRGEYKVRSESMKGLHRDAVSLISQIRNPSIIHVRREDPMISRADALLNIELDIRTGNGRAPIS